MRTALWIAVVAWLQPAPAAAQDQGAAQPVELGASYIGELFAGAVGGEDRGVTHLGTVELTALFDLNDAFGWPDAHVFLHSLTIYGGEPSADYVGDAMVVSNIEAPTTPLSLYEAWFEQELFEQHLSILVGYYALDSEFDFSRTGALFLHSAPGTNNALASSGRAGPSIFPSTSFGARVRVVPVVGTYLQGAVLDGRSGQPGSPGGTRFFGDGEGLLVAYEAGWLLGTEPRGRGPGVRRRYVRRELEGHYDTKVAIGGWAYTAPHQLVGAPGQRRGDIGFYALVDALVLREQEGARQGLSLYARAAATEATMNRFPLFLGGGAVYQGAFPDRDRDELGLAVSVAFAGAPYRHLRSRDGQDTAEAEAVFELTYAARMADWLSVIGDVQYVLNPSADPSIDDALVFLLRAQIAI